MSDTEHDPPGDENISFLVGADILNLLLLHKPFMVFHV